MNDLYMLLVLTIMTFALNYIIKKLKLAIEFETYRDVDNVAVITMLKFITVLVMILVAIVVVEYGNIYFEKI